MGLPGLGIVEEREQCGDVSTADAAHALRGRGDELAQLRDGGQSGALSLRARLRIEQTDEALADFHRAFPGRPAVLLLVTQQDEG